MIYSITSPAREHKRLRDREFERPSGRQIDDKIKLARLLDRISPGFASRSTEPRASDMQPSTTCGPDGPIPRTKRPVESASSVIAVIAVMAGVRAGICIIAVPTLILVVRASTHAAGVTASEP